MSSYKSFKEASSSALLDLSTRGLILASTLLVLISLIGISPLKGPIETSSITILGAIVVLKKEAILASIRRIAFLIPFLSI